MNNRMTTNSVLQDMFSICSLYFYYLFEMFYYTYNFEFIYNMPVNRILTYYKFYLMLAEFSTNEMSLGTHFCL